MSVSNLFTPNSFNLNYGTLTNTNKNNNLTIDVTESLCKTYSGSCTTTSTSPFIFLIINMNPLVDTSMFISCQLSGTIIGGSNAGHAVFEYLYLVVKYLGGNFGYSTIYDENSNLAPIPIGSGGIKVGNTSDEKQLQLSAYDNVSGDIVNWAWNCSVLIANAS